MTDDVVVRIRGDAGTGSVSRGTMERESASIVQAIQSFEGDGRSYWLAIESSEPRSAGETLLVKLAETMLDIVVSQSRELTHLRYLAGLSAMRSRKASGSMLTLRLRESPASFADPAGTLLVDEMVPVSPDDTASESWTLAVHRDLASNVLARADAEYAVEADIAESDAGQDRAFILSRGLDLARSIVSVLPAEPGGPNLADLRVHVLPMAKDADARARVRVWRLGFMKVPGRSRTV